MVHALNEIRRVLVRDGSLIDLRPLLEPALRVPLEIVSSAERRLAGMVEQLPEDRATDEAANRAIAHAEEQGWFIKERASFFPFNYFWDSPNEAQEYFELKWSNYLTVDEASWRKVRSMWATANADARVRLPMRMAIARLRKKA